MKENFEKFKKKVWTDILIKCAVSSLSAAFIAVNAVLLPCKLYGINLLWIYYVLIALGGLLLGGGIAFLILRTDDKKIAKRLDAELNLSERVQTALVFGGQKSDMLELQLENTNEALKPIPARALPFKSIAATALCGIILVCGMVAVPVISYAVPSVYAEHKPDEETKEPPRDVTDWEWAALDDLISYVRASKKADAESKSGMVKELEKLKNLLLDGVSQSSLSLFVQNTASAVANVVAAANENYPNISSEERHPQAIANSEEAEYVVSKLYEIFGLSPQDKPGGEDNPDKNPDENPDDNDPGEGGQGTININEMPFFDPEKGYVMCGEVRDEYYEKVQNALAQGSISKEEWEYIMITYFADLGVKDDD